MKTDRPLRTSSLALAILLAVGVAAFLYPNRIATAASGDVCCIGYTVSGDTVTTVVDFAAANSCQVGGKHPRGGTVCGSSSDLDGCSSMSDQSRCAACGGMHWISTGNFCSTKTAEEIYKENKPDKDAKAK